VRVVPRAISRREQDVEVPPDRVGGRIPENLLGAAVEVNDPLRLIHRYDRVRRDPENAGKLRFRCAQRVFDSLTRAQA
jgi:hypothetical protein